MSRSSQEKGSEHKSSSTFFRSKELDGIIDEDQFADKTTKFTQCALTCKSLGIEADVLLLSFSCKKNVSRIHVETSHDFAFHLMKEFLSSEKPIEVQLNLLGDDVEIGPYVVSSLTITNIASSEPHSCLLTLKTRNAKFDYTLPL